MKNSSLKATNVRTLLQTLFVIVIIGTAAGFYWGIDQVKDQAKSVGHTVADATASGRQLEELEELKQQLAERKTLVEKANKAFTTSSRYQSQAITDVQRYASRTGISIQKTAFSDAGVPAGTRGMVITINNPSSYTQLLQFLDALEGNLPKMQVISLELSRPNNGDPGQINAGDLKISILTRAQ